MAKKIRYLFDGIYEDKHYVKAWKDGRSEIAVQVWKDKTEPIGEPTGDWGMPAVLGIQTCIDQAVAQTK